MRASREPYGRPEQRAGVLGAGLRMSAAVRSSWLLIAASSSVAKSGCEYEWLPMGYPPATMAATESGKSSTNSPVRKKVAGTCSAFERREDALERRGVVRRVEGQRDDLGRARHPRVLLAGRCRCPWAPSSSSCAWWSSSWLGVRWSSWAVSVVVVAVGGSDGRPPTVAVSCSRRTTCTRRQTSAQTNSQDERRESRPAASRADSPVRQMRAHRSEHSTVPPRHRGGRQDSLADRRN